MDSIDGQVRCVLASLVCAGILGTGAPAWAAPCFCDFSKGVETGTYRPDGGDEVLAITVHPPGDEPRFWFDDTTGDYQPYGEQQYFPVEYGKLPVPLEQAVTAWLSGKYSPDDSGELGLALFIQAARDRCVEAPMGELPPAAVEVAKP